MALTGELEHIDIYTPDGYVDAPPHEVFERLRAEQPVFWQDMPGEPGYWAVLKHADVVHVAKHPTLFSASEGGVVLENLDPEQLAMMRDMVLAMDPPRHVEFRHNLVPHFKARAISQLEPRIRGICRSIFDSVRGRGEVDFVHDVSALVPSQVVGELVGIPREDWPQIHAWSEMNSGGQDPDIAAGSYAPEAASATISMAMYAIELAGQRRVEPRDDLVSLMLAAEVDGAPMTDIQFGSFFVQLVTAGNDTTRTMLSSGLLALLQHPEQFAWVRSDPSLLPGAVEEILRWANPLHYFRRTATEDTEIRGQQIAKGEKVAMIYTSANRDADVFEDPHRFDITRDPNPHLSFGIAEHFCLGVHLARLEGRVFFEELFDAFPTIELVGEPRRQRSNLNNALKQLPVHLR
jgi:cholest-4-en-3-one 26-monooxygenase